MAIQTNSLRNAEHDWYATRSGLGNTATLEDHKMAYYGSKGFGGAGKPITQVEREWLQSVGASSAIKPFELWLNACQVKLVPVGKSVNECKFNFFCTIASGTNP